MTHDEIVSELKNLIHLDADAIRAYGQAIDRIDLPAVKERLTAFRGDHERHVSDVSAALRKLGETPPEPKPDAKGFLIEGFTAVRSMTGTEGALEAMRTNEKLTNSKYGDAVQKAFPPDVMPILQRAAADERRHLEYIEETLRMRPWEGAGAGA